MGYRAIIRWLDFNDTWLAAEWGNPSDNLGGILAAADYISQQNREKNKEPLKMKAVLESMIKAHEIQDFAIKNSFNRGVLTRSSGQTSLHICDSKIIWTH